MGMSPLLEERREELRKEERFEKKFEENISSQIFNTSAQMIGVCLTVIGIFALVSHLKNITTFADELVAIDAGVFVCSCGLSYLAMRSKDARRRYLLEKRADAVFLIGLLMMAVIAVLVTVAFFA